MEKDYREYKHPITICKCKGNPEANNPCIYNKKGIKSSTGKLCFFYRESSNRCNNIEKK